MRIRTVSSLPVPAKIRTKEKKVAAAMEDEFEYARKQIRYGDWRRWKEEKGADAERHCAEGISSVGKLKLCSGRSCCWSDAVDGLGPRCRLCDSCNCHDMSSCDSLYLSTFGPSKRQPSATISASLYHHLPAPSFATGKCAALLSFTVARKPSPSLTSGNGFATAW